MVRRTLILGLIAGGLLLAGIGVQGWFDRNAARDVVFDFMEALKQGNRKSAMAHLGPKLRAESEQRAKKAKAGPANKAIAHAEIWAPVPGVQYRVYDVQMDVYRSLVTILVQKNGFVVKPEFTLHRSSGTRWKITQIDGLEVDPRWHDLQQVRARSQGQRLAEALKGRPGVIVERDSLDDKKVGSSD